MTIHYVYFNRVYTDGNERVAFATQAELAPDKVDWDTVEGPETIDIPEGTDIGVIEVNDDGDLIYLTTAEVTARDAALVEE